MEHNYNDSGLFAHIPIRRLHIIFSLIVKIFRSILCPLDSFLYHHVVRQRTVHEVSREPPCSLLLGFTSLCKSCFCSLHGILSYVRMVTLSHDTKSQTRLATQQDMPYQTGRMISLLPKRLISMPSLSTLLMERR